MPHGALCLVIAAFSRSNSKAGKGLDAVSWTISRDSLAELPLIEGGGTARVVASLIGVDDSAPSISKEIVREWRDLLLGMPPDEVCVLNPVLLTGREEVAGAALLILDAVMQRFGFEACIVGQGGLRHGLAREAAGKEAASSKFQAPSTKSDEQSTKY